MGIEFLCEEGIKKMLRGLWVWKGIRKMEGDGMGVVTCGWCCLVLRGLLLCECKAKGEGIKKYLFIYLF